MFVMLLVLVFGAIDFARAIYLRQLLVNLTRETANLEVRGTGDTTVQIMTNALAAAIQEAQPLLDLSSTSVNGKVIITAVTNFGAGTIVSQQYFSGTLAGASLVGPNGITNAAVLPKTGATTILPANRAVYAAEIYYKFTPITPIGKLLFGTAQAPWSMYDAAYFSAL